MNIVSNVALGIGLLTATAEAAVAEPATPPAGQFRRDWSLKDAPDRSRSEGLAPVLRFGSPPTARTDPSPGYRHLDLSGEATRFRPSAPMLGIVIRF
jgi:hypothetical protein